MPADGQAGEGSEDEDAKAPRRDGRFLLEITNTALYMSGKIPPPQNLGNAFQNFENSVTWARTDIPRIARTKPCSSRLG